MGLNDLINNAGLDEKRSDLIFERTDIDKNITKIKFIGSFDLETYNSAKEYIYSICDNEKRYKFIIDLEKTDHIDSSGLGFLIGALKKMKENNGDLKLLNLNAYLKGIFKLLHLNYVVDICSREQEAIDKLK